MQNSSTLPRLLVVDDLFGRNVSSGRNLERENLCAQFLLRDSTGDTAARQSQQIVLKPFADVVFCRAQSPTCAQIGDWVENDMAVAFAALRQGWHSANPGSKASAQEGASWSMLLLDLCFYTGRVTEASDRQASGMPDGRPGDDDPDSYFGLALLERIHRELPELPIFILSSKPREDISLEISRLGALGFIDRGSLQGPELLRQALWNHGLLPDPSHQVLGQSLPLLLTLREARRAARHAQNVLIRGERGTGKELVAQYIHRAWSADDDDRKRPFVAVNTPALTPLLFGSELYGIEPRTATGVDGKIGLIEMADGGVLFLDEITDMAPEVQASLLRVIQERQIVRVGARTPREIDVRFLAATNALIEEQASEFRSDLLDRLCNGGIIWLPALRQRLADIRVLAPAFVRAAESRRAGALTRTITTEALSLLESHDWPGNVRELQTVITDAVNRHPDIEYLVPEHLRIGIRDSRGIRRSSAPFTPPGPEPPGIKVIEAHGLDDFLVRMGRVSFSLDDTSEWAGSLDRVLAEQQRFVARMIEAALSATTRRSPDNPSGSIKIHPAVKLLIGDTTLTASKAADTLKRLLGPIADSLEGDLKEAYEISLRLRPKRGKP